MEAHQSEMYQELLIDKLAYNLHNLRKIYAIDISYMYTNEI